MRDQSLGRVQIIGGRAGGAGRRRRRVAKMRVAAIALLSLCAGCSGAVTECSALYAYGLAVTVIDEATGAPICTATVTASDGAYHETLRLEQLSAPDGGVECLYPGAGE